MEALVELGGRAEMSKVLDLVERKMRGIWTIMTISLYPRTLIPSVGVTRRSGVGIRWSERGCWRVTHLGASGRSQNEVTTQPCHCEPFSGEAISHLSGQIDRLGIASSQRTLLAM